MAVWAWPTWVVSRRRVLEAVFVLLVSPSPSRRIFIGSHSLPPPLSGSSYRSFSAAAHADDSGEDSRLPGRDAGRGGEEEGKRPKSAVSADTTTISSDVETIDVDDDEGDTQSPKATIAPSLGKQAVETPRSTLKTQGRSTSSTDPAGDVGSKKRMKKAPPKPCKPGLRLATKKVSSPTYSIGLRFCFRFDIYLGNFS
jgi:hypothetical protein